jgi:hypothetical protein
MINSLTTEHRDRTWLDREGRFYSWDEAVGKWHYQTANEGGWLDVPVNGPFTGTGLT